MGLFLILPEKRPSFFVSFVVTLILAHRMSMIEKFQQPAG